MDRFPDETVDHIFSFIDDREDLLSPALVSRRFALIAQPHLQYRVIRCTLCTTDLWNHLSANKVLAQNVRKLEIQRQLFYLNTKFAEPIVPPCFVIQAHDPENRNFYEEFPVEDLPRFREAEGALVRAIKCLSNLKSFTWDRCAPLLDSNLDEDVRDDIWTALGNGCPALDHLHVMDASENEDNHQYIRPVHHSAIWKLQQDLKSFKYHSYAYRYIDQPVPVDNLTAMLRRCSNIEALSIGFTLYGVQDGPNGEDVSTANLNELLANIYWPKLHTLRTFSVHVSPSTAARFFKSHPTLVRLQILEGTEQARFIKDDPFNPDGAWPVPTLRPTLSPGSLPNLKIMYAPEYISEAIVVAQGLSPNIIKSGRYGSLSPLYDPKF